MKLLLGDCLEQMKSLEDNSIDACITDPPYGLSFMGKKWDYDVPKKEIWQEVLRVLKPGGYLLSFAGTRTQHRMAVNIEDAGFEIRDMIAWVYGSGFPKSLNIGKAVDKLQGNIRKDLGVRIGATGKRKSKIYGDRPILNDPNYQPHLTKGTSEWEGWGTALKPALEPITVARKPIEGTVAENCLKWNVGGINIDGSRIEIVDKENYNFNNNGMSRLKRLTGDKLGQFDGGWKIDKTKRETPLGRFPANLIHDGSEEVTELFPNSKSTGGSGEKSKGKMGTLNWEGQATGGFNDSGSASRFFYCAKASKSERNRGCEDMEERIVNDGREKDIDNAYQRGTTLRKNTHPTVKPIALMEYLIKLVSKEGHTILDPFMGSGSTGIACRNLNREFIGIELEPDYMKIAEARIYNTIKHLQEELWI